VSGRRPRPGLSLAGE